MKKFYLVLLVLTLIASMAGLVACGDKGGEKTELPEQTSVEKDNIVYSVNSDKTGAVVTGVGSGFVSGALTIESKIKIGSKEYPVEEIGKQAFKKCAGLTGITIPDTVKSIGVEAFSNCSNLERIHLPAKMAKLSDYAFTYCGSIKEITVDENNEYFTSVGGNLYSKDKKVLLIYAAGQKASSFIVPEGTQSIGTAAFYSSSGLIDVVVAESVENIMPNAFNNCTSLKSITIPSDVKNIGFYAFAWCTALERIHIGEGVENIEYGTLIGCTALNEIEVDAKNIAYTSVDGNLYSKDGKTLVQYAAGKTQSSFVIPEGVKTLEYAAFYNAQYLKSIDIPRSVTKIDDSVFVKCTSLESIVIPASVTEMGIGEFNLCTALRTIYCEAESKPDGWDKDWNYSKTSVQWGYVG